MDSRRVHCIVLQDNTMQCNMNEYMTILIVIFTLSDARKKIPLNFKTYKHDTRTAGNPIIFMSKTIICSQHHSPPSRFETSRYFYLSVYEVIYITSWNNGALVSRVNIANFKYFSSQRRNSEPQVFVRVSRAISWSDFRDVLITQPAPWTSHFLEIKQLFLPERSPRERSVTPQKVQGWKGGWQGDWKGREQETCICINLVFHVWLSKDCQYNKLCSWSINYLGRIARSLAHLHPVLEYIQKSWQGRHSSKMTSKNLARMSPSIA